MKLFKCDKCGEVGKDGFQTLDLSFCKSNVWKKFQEIHLCQKCTEEIWNMIEKFLFYDK